MSRSTIIGRLRPGRLSTPVLSRVDHDDGVSVCVWGGGEVITRVVTRYNPWSLALNRRRRLFETDGPPRPGTIIFRAFVRPLVPLVCCRYRRWNRLVLRSSQIGPSENGRARRLYGESGSGHARPENVIDNVVRDFVRPPVRPRIDSSDRI